MIPVDLKSFHSCTRTCTDSFPQLPSPESGPCSTSPRPFQLKVVFVSLILKQRHIRPSENPKQCAVSVATVVSSVDCTCTNTAMIDRFSARSHRRAYPKSSPRGCLVVRQRQNCKCNTSYIDIRYESYDT